MAKPKKKRAKKAPAPPRTVPRRKKGESLVAYHDRLSGLAAEAMRAGDHALSDRLQRKAGKIAHEDESVARRPREGTRTGPGTYPWYECVEDQTRRARTSGMTPDDARERANNICGRIRATSRGLYPAYWASREGRSSNPESDGRPYAGIALDGGPRSHPHRDMVVVLDRSGSILDLHPIFGDHSLRELDSKYPGLPIFGPFEVLASNVREIVRTAEQGTPHVQIR